MDDGKPSRESMREVKREARERAKADKQRAKAAQEYWRQQSGKAPRSSGGPVAGVLVAVLVLGLGGAALLISRGGLPGLSGSDDVAASARPTTSPSPSPASASTSPTPGAGAEVAVVAPFEDSPATTWPVGAKGIRTPAPKQVGVYRAAQVKDAYAQLTRYLTVAVLDPRVTYQGKLDPVWAVLPRESSSWFRSNQKLFQSSKGAKGFTYDSLANRFYPKDWKGAAEIRVKTRVTPTIGKGGALTVKFVVVAAYWMEPRAGGPGRTIVVHRDGEANFYGRGTGRAGPMYLGGSGYTSTASVCGADYPHDGYVEAWTDKSAAPVVTPSAAEQTFNPGDENADAPDGCYVDTSGF